MINFKTLDLNLLRSLDTLLHEKNVTRAAKQLNLSQPSVSIQLAKLRDIFNDPLLLPSPRGMQLTTRAQALQGPLHETLMTLEQTIAAPLFNPAIATHTWHIAATDYSESTLILPVLNYLRSEAPGTRLAVLEMNPAQIFEQAEENKLDLVFHLCNEAPKHWHQRILFKESYVLAGRKDHPALQQTPTLAEMSALEYVIVSPEGRGFYGITDQILAEHGMTRNVVLSVPHFLFVISALCTTNLVALLPKRLVINNPALAIRIPPVDIPGFDMAMLWHERVHRDPGHQWLRRRIMMALS